VVLQPSPFSCADRASCRPAWQAIEARQRARAASYVLVTQPDHAQLSGDLAAQFVSPAFPALSGDAVAAIAAHDSGWAQMPGESDANREPMLTPEGKPRSFIEFTPPDFTRAWSGSIDHASSLSALGGMIVSLHFTSLADFAMRRLEGQAEATEVLCTFLRDEELRQRALTGNCKCSQREIDENLKALQFCDLLSLALCCDVREPVEFPQPFGGTPVRMQFRDGAFELTPSPFQRTDGERRELRFEVVAKRFPQRNNAQQLSFTLR
jgi:uncharacterized protein DUF3891